MITVEYNCQQLEKDTFNTFKEAQVKAKEQGNMIIKEQGKEKWYVLPDTKAFYVLVCTDEKDKQ